MVDGEERPTSLFDDIMATQQHSNNNNVIKFNDNSRCVRPALSRLSIRDYLYSGDKLTRQSNTIGQCKHREKI